MSFLDFIQTKIHIFTLETLQQTLAGSMVGFFVPPALQLLPYLMTFGIDESSDLGGLLSHESREGCFALSRAFDKKV